MPSGVRTGKRTSPSRTPSSSSISLERMSPYEFPIFLTLRLFAITIAPKYIWKLYVGYNIHILRLQALLSSPCTSTDMSDSLFSLQGGRSLLYSVRSLTAHTIPEASCPHG